MHHCTGPQAVRIRLSPSTFLTLFNRSIPTAAAFEPLPMLSSSITPPGWRSSRMHSLAFVLTPLFPLTDRHLQCSWASVPVLLVATGTAVHMILLAAYSSGIVFSAPWPPSISRCLVVQRCECMLSVNGAM